MADRKITSDSFVHISIEPLGLFIDLVYKTDNGTWLDSEILYLEEEPSDQNFVEAAKLAKDVAQKNNISIQYESEECCTEEEKNSFIKALKEQNIMGKN